MPYPKGKPKSEESKLKASASCKSAWTEAKKQERRAKYTGDGNPFFGKTHSEESLARMSAVHTGVTLSESCKKKISESLLGNQRAKGNRFSLTEERRREIGERFRGEKCTFWRGGITPKHLLIRNSIDYKDWRKAVFERDKYTCQSCGKIGGQLNAHHIRPFCAFEDHRLDVDNGQTLCVPCHRKTDSFAKNSVYQVN